MNGTAVDPGLTYIEGPLTAKSVNLQELNVQGPLDISENSTVKSQVSIFAGYDNNLFLIKNDLIDRFFSHR